MVKSFKFYIYLSLLSVILLPLFTNSVQADTYWAASGNNIYNTNTANVGIGTSSPDSHLHIWNNAGSGFDSFSDYQIVLYDTGAANTSYGIGIENNTMMFNANHDYKFYVNNSPVITFDDGAIGVATTSPGAALDLRADNALNLGAGQDLRLTVSNDDVYFRQATLDKDIYFQVNDNGSTVTALSIDGSENKVGIGMTGPSALVHLRDGSAGERLLQFGTEVYLTETNQDGILGVYADDYPDEGKIKFGAQGPVVGSKDGNGNEHFRVGGTLIAEEIIVQSDAWADYVFDDSYRLTPLGELEQYINENGHLPDVPSTEEITENGINVEEMNKILLQKIEELTLYSIDLQKQVDELKMAVNHSNNVCR